MKKIQLPVFACLLLMACAVSYRYSFSLLSVDRPVPAVEKYGPPSIEKPADSAAGASRFSDSLVDIRFSITTNQFEFTCKNKSDRSIKIDWEKAAYINPYGARKRVIHSGIRYERKADRQLPAIIRKGETLVDFLMPAENVNVYLYGSGGFAVYPLFSSRDFGKNVKVVLPLEADGVANEYIFQFALGPL